MSCEKVNDAFLRHASFGNFTRILQLLIYFLTLFISDCRKEVQFGLF